MRYQYGEFDGDGFKGPDALFPSPKMIQFILSYGQEALDAMQEIDPESAEAQYVQALIEAGLMEEQKNADGTSTLTMTPRMLKGMQHRALLEIFKDMAKGVRGSHDVATAGRTLERTEGTRQYEFGDPLSEVDLSATLRNTIRRQLQETPPGEAAPSEVTPETSSSDSDQSGLQGLKLNLKMNDFEVHQTESRSDCATVLLIDQSGSMLRYGRFLQAKRVAMGLQAMINAQFPNDSLDYVGFYSLADKLTERDIPLAMPKPVSIRDYEVRLRAPLAEAESNPEKIPLHFTNLHLGLQRARAILQRRGAANKQIFLITDGQPTAHIQSDDKTGEDWLYLLYPPTEETAQTTLREALMCRQAGIRIASFALIEDYWGMDWVSFIEQMTRLTRGVAFYNTGEDLASTVIESYLSGRKTKKYVGA